jgi:NADH-quinone oxidoreductase subunit J
MEFVIFLIVAAVSVASGVSMIVQRNAMYSALFLVLNFFCLAVFYVLMGAFFLAVVQVAVYAGAIMVLVLFVIMLLNVAQPEASDRRLGLFRPFGVIAALVLLAELVAVGVRYGALPQPQAVVSTGAAAATPAVTPTPLIRPAPAALPVAAEGPSGVGAAEFGHTQMLASVLFSKYLFPFEVTSILLLGAILGATILARKRGDIDHVDPVEGVRVK